MPIDYKEYPANWKTEIRPSVLARTNNCCEECGIANYSVVRKNKNWNTQISHYTWDLPHNYNSAVAHRDELNKQNDGDGKWSVVVLTIAHLDHDKSNENVTIDRLKALCQRCHLKYDMNRNIENRKYGVNHRENNYKLEFEI